MPKLTIEELEKLRERAKKATFLRETTDYRAKITVHMGTCGIAAGAREIMNAFLQELQARDITDVLLTNSGCAGLCSREPMATIEIKGQAPVKYVDLTPEKVKQIFEKHVLGGEIVQDYALGIGSEKTDY
ncbi:MAG: (2Fe-2S) ferredoxin domain-containing protein [Candidatus Aminicenantes bacterium]|nr:(2Fe-2S) ferredoxin domain-containing protein [Candidatus Aminicenantes bacterium]OQX52436.1 MAG: NADP oxidoreductase [Candidatus Aminicenantes bacterium 4484_214]RLE04063.1 MAG: (2Fe-2S) ferredoxin domain-containing protein [Candidatus Aminicenantes bacterium]RLE06119.1 MAG: (2Fe-2S) ferredoxin domain-containing protein [Candidatus Aminicenantes bacterium]HHF43425.1 (2Fe-2S) ferredoxin domain-containing protein [Candidatus Aminicenantes bacterium]